MSEQDTNRSNRRDLLKAAGAAGIIWTAPLVKPVTAHAAGTCTRVQYDFAANAGAGGFVTPSINNDDLTFPAKGVNGCVTCLPGGQVFASNCVCASGWASGVDRTTNAGTVSPGGSAGASTSNTYTAPTGCQIVDAQALLYDATGSGCSAFSCATIGGGISINAANTQLTLASPGSNVYLRLRVLLCCSP